MAIDQAHADTLRALAASEARVAELEEEIEKWKHLAAQIRTDWMPANERLAARAKAAESQAAELRARCEALEAVLPRCLDALREAMSEYGLTDGDVLTRRIEALLSEPSAPKASG